MTEIYLHIVARMADGMATHPAMAPQAALAAAPSPSSDIVKSPATARRNCVCVWISSAMHARIIYVGKSQSCMLEKQRVHRTKHAVGAPYSARAAALKVADT